MEMKPDSGEAISRLIRLKRYEHPPKGYYRGFLVRLRRRQMVEILRRPWWATAWDGLFEIWPSFEVPRVAYVALVGAAVVAGGLLLHSGQRPSELARGDVKELEVNLTLTPKLPVTIGKTLPASSRVEGPQYYVLEPRPASHERPFNF